MPLLPRRSPRGPLPRRLGPAPAGALAFLLAAALLGSRELRAEEPIRLKIVGGLAGITQYTLFEQPFWTKEVERLTGGRVTATIRPFEASGLRGQEMLQLLRLGVVPFGTAILAVVAGEEPELNAVDLPALSPDMASLRRTVAGYRDHLRRILRERYNIELLGIYAYPAQVLYCAKAFGGLDDLAGRRVRTSSVSQSELVAALGAVPVLLPFSEMVKAVRERVVDCAITGTQSANEIGLADVTSHVLPTAINWGVSFFGANASVWESLPADLRESLAGGIADLERRIWERSERDTALGLACNVGAAECPADARKSLTLVPPSRSDDLRRRQLLTEVVLPRWGDRCGPDCAQSWNRLLAPVANVSVKAE